MHVFHAILHFDQFTPGEHSCYQRIEANGIGEASQEAERIAHALPIKERPSSVSLFGDRGDLRQAFTVSR